MIHRDFYLSLSHLKGYANANFLKKILCLIEENPRIMTNMYHGWRVQNNEKLMAKIKPNLHKKFFFVFSLKKFVYLEFLSSKFCSAFMFKMFISVTDSRHAAAVVVAMTGQYIL